MLRAIGFRPKGDKVCGIFARVHQPSMFACSGLRLPLSRLASTQGCNGLAIWRAKRTRVVRPIRMVGEEGGGNDTDAGSNVCDSGQN